MGLEKRGRPKKASAEMIYDTLASSEGPMSVNELAELSDVSDETIRKRLEEVENYPGVRKKQIGTAFVYWQDSEDWGLGDYSDGPLACLSTNSSVDLSTLQIQSRSSLVQNRAEWLEVRSWYVSTRGRTNTPLEESVARRRGLLEALRAYMNQTNIHLPAAFASDEVGDAEAVDYDAESYGLAGEEYYYYADEVHLFPTSLDLHGLTACLASFVQLTRDLDETNDLERLDDMLPPAEEIIHAGGVYDDFLTSLLEVEW